MACGNSHAPRKNPQIVPKSAELPEDVYKRQVNTGIKILDCTFMGDTSKMASNGYAAISLKADSRTFEDIEVSGCKFTNYFQGIYAQGADGIQIKNNVFDGTTHNAIAVQNGASNKVGGEIIIEENIIKNAGDRAIRFVNAAEAELITVQNLSLIHILQRRHGYRPRERDVCRV